MILEVSRVPINWHAGLSIYASEMFLRAISKEYGWIGGIDDLGNLRCILPYTVLRKAFFRIVRFRTATIPIGEDLDIGEERTFLNHTASLFRSNGVDMIIPATANAIFRTYPDGAIAAPYGTYIIDLCQAEEVLWGNMNATYRKKIRNAMKNNVQIRSGLEYIDASHALIKDTLKRSKMKFMSLDAFRRLVLALNDNTKIFVAEYQGAIQGCTIFPYSQECAYSLHGGRIPVPEAGVMNFLNWEAIRQFQQMGVKKFDFMGVRINPEKCSKQEGIQIFKQRFGGQLVQGYMWKYSFNPLKYALYSLAVRCMKGGDIVDNERHKLSGA